MRVLWFTNTPSLSAKYLKKTSLGGGWIESLEAKLAENPSIELGICFNVDDNNVNSFKIGKTNYYPVPVLSPRNKLQKIISRWSKPIQDENDIEPYLKIVQEFRPNLINIFGTEGPFGLIISKVNLPCVIHIQGNLTVYNYKWYSGVSDFDVLRYSKKWSLLKGYGLYHKYFINRKTVAREKEIFVKCKYFMGRTDWDRRITSVLSPDSKYFHCDEILRSKFYKHQWAPASKQTVTLL